MKYYAEFDTDKIIREKFFPDFSYMGTMVEVGAGPTVFYSMSKHFRENGWRCICVEPNPKFVNEHKSLGNEIYPFACSYEEKDSTFKIVQKTGKEDLKDKNNNVSYSALDIKYQIKDSEPHIIKEIPIKVIKLNTLLEDLKIEKIDFISIDTEGWELEVMMGFDVEKYSPKVIILENYTYLDSYVEYMNKIGYELFDKVKYNYIFVKKK